MRILFVSSTRIGDAVLSTGLLAHLLDAHPRARFTVACGPAAAGVFARMPRLERLLVLEKRRLARHWFALWRAVVPTRWDLVVDLRASALAWTLRTRSRAVMRGGRREGHRIGHLGDLLGLRPPPSPVAWWSAADAARAAALVPPGPSLAHPLLARPLLILAPTANWDRKTWPAERFVALAGRLRAPGGALEGARVAVLGGPGAAERAAAAPVLASLPEALDLVGALSLPEAAALLSRAALFVGNDSGLMHLAASAGAPTLGLFGPTPAGEYAPVGPRARAVLADGPPGMASMAALPVGKVLDAAAALLETEAVPCA